MQGELLESTRTRLRGLAGKAIDVIERHLDEGSLKAAVELMKAVSFYGQVLAPNTQTDPELIVKQQAESMAAAEMRKMAYPDNNAGRLAYDIGDESRRTALNGTGVMIEIFTNRIEFTNPGRPLIDLLRFIDYSPTSRNEKLASTMRRLGMCEERGSGIDKVVHALERNGLPPLKLQEEDNYFRATVFSHKEFKDMDRMERVMATYQHACLKYIEGDTLSNQSLRERLGIEEKNYPMVSRVISDAIEERLIREADPLNRSKRMTRYIPFWA